MHRAHSRQFTTQFGSFITVHVVEQWGQGRTWGKGDLGHGEGYGAGMEGPEAPWRIPEGGPGVGEARRPDGEYEGGGGSWDADRSQGKLKIFSQRIKFWAQRR